MGDDDSCRASRAGPPPNSTVSFYFQSFSARRKLQMALTQVVNRSKNAFTTEYSMKSLVFAAALLLSTSAFAAVDPANYNCAEMQHHLACHGEISIQRLFGSTTYTSVRRQYSPIPVAASGFTQQRFKGDSKSTSCSALWPGDRT